VTGNLDNTTVTQMLAPRCGFPDLPPTESNPNSPATFKACKYNNYFLRLKNSLKMSYLTLLDEF
jgi:hypothetical protein